MLEAYKVLGAMARLSSFTARSLAEFSGVRLPTVRTVIARRSDLLEEIGQETTGKRGGRFKKYQLRPEKKPLIEDEIGRLSVEMGFLPSVKREIWADNGLPLSLRVAEDNLLSVFPAAQTLEEKQYILRKVERNFSTARQELMSGSSPESERQDTGEGEASAAIQRVEALKMLAFAEIESQSTGKEVKEKTIRLISNLFQEINKDLLSRHDSKQIEQYARRLQVSPLALSRPKPLPSREDAVGRAAGPSGTLGIRDDFQSLAAGAAATFLGTCEPKQSWLSVQAPLHAIGVLPFTGSGRRYIRHGLTNAITNLLSRVPHLVVKSPSPAYEDDRLIPIGTTATRIGRELRVPQVLVGSISEQAGMLRCRTELVDVNTGHRTRYGPYEGSIGQISALEKYIFRDVLKDISEDWYIGLKEAPKWPVNTTTESTEAYDLYLQGRDLWTMWTAGATKEAIRFFTAALHKDPTFALAYAGLADCYNMLTYESNVPPQECFPIATENAYKAIELDRQRAEAFNSLAYARFRYDWMWPEAETLYRLAISLNPNYGVARQWYAESLAAMGRFDEANAQIELATELDPVSPFIRATKGSIFYFAGQYDLAINEFREILRSTPDYTRAHFRLGGAYAQVGMYDDAIAELKQIQDSSSENLRSVALLGYVYAISKYYSRALEVVRRLEDLSITTYVSPYTIALIYAGLGESSSAFNWLQRGLVVRDPWMVFLKVDPRMAVLRSYPAFRGLLHRIGLDVLGSDIIRNVLWQYSPTQKYISTESVRSIAPPTKLLLK